MIIRIEVVGLCGLEPQTSSLSVTRSNQLSYSPLSTEVFYHKMVETRGFEPRTSCLQSRRTSQLSYVPKACLFYLKNRGYTTVRGGCTEPGRPGRRWWRGWPRVLFCLGLEEGA